MSSSNDKPLCIQKRLLGFIKKDWKLWLIIFPVQIVISLVASLFLTSPYYPYIIPAELSNRMLSSLIDVFIALFGFVGLIFVFTLRNLLTTKGNLQREKFDTDLTKTQFDRQLLSSLIGTDAYAMNRLMSIIEKCEKRLEEINDGIAHNKEQIDDALFLGFMSLGFAVTCILMNIWAFGAIGNEGLYFTNLAILIIPFFLCIDFIGLVVRAVIE
ncbi:MAG: hypothetical protein ACE5I5_20330 [Candidatus Heimdallarchaeota archaeon]